jgi:hypothetical protein
LCGIPPRRHDESGALPKWLVSACLQVDAAQFTVGFRISNVHDNIRHLPAVRRQGNGFTLSIVEEDVTNTARAPSRKVACPYRVAAFPGVPGDRRSEEYELAAVVHGHAAHHAALGCQLNERFVAVTQIKDECIVPWQEPERVPHGLRGFRMGGGEEYDHQEKHYAQRHL